MICRHRISETILSALSQSQLRLLVLIEVVLVPPTLQLSEHSESKVRRASDVYASRFTGG